MLGGFNVFGTGAYVERTFTNLPSHTKIRIQATFYKIDSWDGEEYYIIYILNKFMI